MGRPEFSQGVRSPNSDTLDISNDILKEQFAGLQSFTYQTQQDLNPAVYLSTPQAGNIDIKTSAGGDFRNLKSVTNDGSVKYEEITENATDIKFEYSGPDTIGYWGLNRPDTLELYDTTNFNISSTLDKTQFDNSITTIDTQNGNFYVFEFDGDVYEIDKKTREKTKVIDFNGNINHAGIGSNRLVIIENYNPNFALEGRVRAYDTSDFTEESFSPISLTPLTNEFDMDKYGRHIIISSSSETKILDLYDQQFEYTENNGYDEIYEVGGGSYILGGFMKDTYLLPDTNSSKTFVSSNRWISENGLSYNSNYIVYTKSTTDPPDNNLTVIDRNGNFVDTRDNISGADYHTPTIDSNDNIYLLRDETSGNFNHSLLEFTDPTNLSNFNVYKEDEITPQGVQQYNTEMFDLPASFDLSILEKP